MLVGAALASMIGTLCVARVAQAEPAPLKRADFGGRWVSKEASLTLDITRCGEGWCGVLVTNNKSCGHTALRVAESPQDAVHQTDKTRELVGRLQLAANTEPYGVRTALTRDDGGAMALRIAGHTGGIFSAFRRSYDYNQLLVREGDAACSPNPRVSQKAGQAALAAAPLPVQLQGIRMRHRDDVVARVDEMDLAGHAA
jgi:hypothetical protein